MVEDSQSNGRFPYPAWADQSDRSEVFGEADNLLNQLGTPETSPRRRGR